MNTAAPLAPTVAPISGWTICPCRHCCAEYVLVYRGDEPVCEHCRRSAGEGDR